MKDTEQVLAEFEKLADDWANHLGLKEMQGVGWTCSPKNRSRACIVLDFKSLISKIREGTP